MDTRILISNSRYERKKPIFYLWEYDKDGENETTIERQGFYGFEKTMTFSPDGSILLDLGHVRWNPHVELWDVKTGRKMGRLIGHTEFITSLVFSHGGKILSSTSEDGTILIWDWEKIVSKVNNPKLKHGACAKRIPSVHSTS